MAVCKKAAFWAIDCKQSVLDIAPNAGHVLVEKDRDRSLLPLPEEEISRIVGTPIPEPNSAQPQL